ncbi:MAG: DUF4911 domain-containing protein [Candidatus Tectomicrobia bacterium]|uniref:DUF4911 domain-containing protein n=1 Tax=Tectimicrobiota bacterium TaxID=2528274 RepID=A0A932LZR7_UNCTE|nr:DUF4911 domain-containing protein [Candidatus Tectomicrobia bacterium]
MAHLSESIRFLIQIPKREIVYLHGLLEAYEGLAVVRTIDPLQGIVELLASPSFAEEVEEVLKNIALEIPLRILECTTTLRLGN